MKRKNNIIKRLLLSILIANSVLLVFLIRNLVGEYYLGYNYKVILIITMFLVSTLYFRILGHKKYGLIFGGIIFILSVIIVYKADDIILLDSIKKNGGLPVVAEFVEKRVKGKSGTDGIFKIDDERSIRWPISSKETIGLEINDTVLFIESIKFPSQFDVLNYFPSSDEISKAKSYKYYYKGEYVDSLSR